MRAADIAMYRAKSVGGGQHCLFDAELASEHPEEVRAVPRELVVAAGGGINELILTRVERNEAELC